jgi:hypothetical protein
MSSPPCFVDGETLCREGQELGGCALEREERQCNEPKNSSRLADYKAAGLEKVIKGGNRQSGKMLEEKANLELVRISIAKRRLLFKEKTIRSPISGSW